MRALQFEKLEKRLMPCAPAQVLSIIQTVNAGTYSEEADLNRDGMVSPLDVLISINEANWRTARDKPAEMRPNPNGGGSSLSFSPCGETLSILVFSKGVTSPEDARIVMRRSGQEYTPTEVGTFGKFQTIEFQVFGRGVEYISVMGQFDDDLLTVIVG